MSDYLLNIGANPGRSGHRLSVDAARVVFATREALAELLGVSDSRRVVFTSNATEAINTVLLGMLHPGDHVVVSAMEHNSVMRPLRWLAETQGVRIAVAPVNADGYTTPTTIADVLTSSTCLVVVNHASNVTGTIAPVAEIKQVIGDVPLLVDAAQTAGVLPIDMERDGIDMLACTGHKALLGPTGIGCLFLGTGMAERIAPLKRGGTGSHSEHEEHPANMPDRFEAGTLNAVGIAGLGAGVRYLLERGIADVRRHELALTTQLLHGLTAISGVSIYGACEPERQVATVSINVDGIAASDVAQALDQRYQIMVRAGLHCAPAAHRTIGTFPDGTVRLSLGALNTADDVDRVLAALAAISARVR